MSYLRVLRLVPLPSARAARRLRDSPPPPRSPALRCEKLAARNIQPSPAPSLQKHVRIASCAYSVVRVRSWWERSASTSVPPTRLPWPTTCASCRASNRASTRTCTSAPPPAHTAQTLHSSSCYECAFATEEHRQVEPVARLPCGRPDLVPVPLPGRRIVSARSHANSSEPIPAGRTSS